MPVMATTHDVSVIGLGAMGAEIAKVLVASDRRVLVWNRSSKKAEALASAGAEVATSPAHAIGASPITIMCLWDYSACDEVLSAPGVSDALGGKTLVQLTTGSASEATHQGDRVHDAGGAFLAGGIMCYPRAVGNENTVFIYSGNRLTFGESAEILAVLAPAHRHVGEAFGDVAVIYTAVWDFYFSAMGGLFEGMALTAASGLDPRHLKPLLGSMVEKMLEGAEDAFQRIETRGFDGDQATVGAHIEGLTATCVEIEGTRVEPRMLKAFVDQLSVARDCGRELEDLAAVADSLISVALATARSDAQGEWPNQGSR